ncbi:MAG: hypothetical protein ACRENC_15060, partial [Gemmatimonadaceae bacterium]
VDAVLKELGRGGFWDDPDVHRHLRSLVPEYRLSKFQRVLPDAWQTEMIGVYLLDFEGAARVTEAFPTASRTMPLIP